MSVEELKFLKSERFRLSGWEKRFLRGIEKKKETELSASQRLWLAEILNRVEKQKRWALEKRAS